MLSGREARSLILKDLRACDRNPGQTELSGGKKTTSVCLPSGLPSLQQPFKFHGLQTNSTWYCVVSGKAFSLPSYPRLGCVSAAWSQDSFCLAGPADLSSSSMYPSKPFWICYFPALKTICGKFHRQFTHSMDRLFFFFSCFFWACRLTDAECFLEEMANNCHLFCKLEIHGLFIYFSHRCHLLPFIISDALFYVFFAVLQVFLRWGDQDCRKYSRSEYTMDFHSSMRLFSVLFSIHFWLSKIYFFDYWQRKNPYLLSISHWILLLKHSSVTVRRKKPYPGSPALLLCSGQCRD